MSTRDFFDHNNPDGEGLTEQARRAGLSVTDGFYIGIAENIHMISVGNFRGCSTYQEDELAECIIKDWMDSPGHRANILDSNYDQMGLGVYCSGGRCYSTQKFR